jgi:hypothetical protein
MGVDYERLSGETALPKGVILKSNEPGAMGIGTEVIPLFNNHVTGVSGKKE